MAESLQRDDLLALPKVDLHVHLDGSLRLETLLELAENQGVDLPESDPEALKKHLHLGQRCKDLNQYLEAFAYTTAVMQDETSLERIAYELVEDCAGENIRYFEVRFAPNLHINKGLSLQAVMDSVLAGLKRGEEDFGVVSGLIVCGIRNMSPEISYRLARLTASYKGRGVVGFDLAGAEFSNPAKYHIKAFYYIVNHNINCTVHAGEAFGAESIHQAIHYNHAHRIGHGTRLYEDDDLADYVNDHRIPLEVCLKSNVQTGAVENIESHPFPRFLQRGIRVTLNTDNRLITDTTITDELLLAHESFGFSLLDLKKIILNGFKSMFQPYKVRKQWLEKMRRELGLEEFYSPDFGTLLDKKE